MKRIKSKILLCITTNCFIWAGIGIGILFWILEAGIHSFIFHEGNFTGHIFTPNLHEFWMRLLVAIIIIQFGCYAQYMLAKLQQEKNTIKRVNLELDQIFNTAADGMRLIDKNFNVLRINKTLLNMSGRSKDETIGKKCYETFHGSHCQTANCPLSRILNGEEYIECDAEKEQKDGTKIFCILAAVTFRKPTGELIGIIEDFKDITKRKETEKALLESKLQLNIVSKIAQILLIESDEKVQAVVSDAMESKHGLFGYISQNGSLVYPSITQPVLKKCQISSKELVFPRETWRGIWGKSLIERKAIYSNTPFRVPQGHIAIHRALSMPVINKEEVIGHFFIGNKKTDYNEKDIKRLEIIAIHIAPILQARLERDKQQKKRIKAEKALKKALMKAKEADRLKTAFLANMSHEIRTPLNPVLGFTDLMLNDELSTQHKKYLSIIKKSVNLLVSIIDDILDFSKIEANQVEIKQIPCSLEAILENIKSSCQILISQNGKNIDLKQNFSDNISRFIIGDPTRIQQIMNNLINNAVKFTEKGFIEYGIILKDKNTLKFYVKDTGIGIPKDKQEEIFMRFHQADVSHTRKYGGTGLGLTISKKLVELMGGVIKLQSNIDTEHGSIFYFTLPYKPTDIKISTNLVKTKIQESKTNYTILIAEDDIMNQVFAQELLEKSGYNVIVTNDGEKAVSTYKSNPSIDLILMDIQMPVFNGLEATKVIRSIKTKEKKKIEYQ